MRTCSHVPRRCWRRLEDRLRLPPIEGGVGGGMGQGSTPPAGEGASGAVQLRAVVVAARLKNEGKAPEPSRSSRYRLAGTPAPLKIGALSPAGASPNLRPLGASVVEDVVE